MSVNRYREFTEPILPTAVKQRAVDFVERVRQLWARGKEEEGEGEGTIESPRGRSLMIRVRFLENNSLASEEQAVVAEAPLPPPNRPTSTRRSIPLVDRYPS